MNTQVEVVGGQNEIVGVPPIRVCGLKPSTLQVINPELKRREIPSSAFEILSILDERLCKQVDFALGAAMDKAYLEPGCPVVEFTSTSANTVSTRKVLPLMIITNNGNDGKPGTILFCKVEGSTEEQYYKARDRVLTMTNGILRLFEKPTIPSFPSHDEMEELL